MRRSKHNMQPNHGNNQRVQVTIESIDLEGKGIARIDGKAVFIHGALPQEVVLVEIYKQKPSFDLGRLISIIEPSPDRVIPECPNFGVCGGCSQQHISVAAQILNKQQVLIDNLKHIGKVSPQSILPPLTGAPWGYRHRARMSARFVIKKGEALVGFRESGSPYVAEMSECRILPQHISDLLPKLRELLGSLKLKHDIPQIEVAVGDKSSVLVFRIMQELPESDAILIRQFVDTYHQTQNLSPNQDLDQSKNQLQIWLQPKGLDSCRPFYPNNTEMLSYSLPEFAIEMPYHPTEFTQVNPELNKKMVHQAITLLDLKPDDRVIDFFCGIGNFTLPIAKNVATIMAIEGSEALVKRATENAKHNNLDHKVVFKAANLFAIDAEWLKQLGKQDKWLIDPPRDGCFELVKSITDETAPSMIVYISCNPATLARDAEVLVHTHGYKLMQAGVMDMFPHTSHVESIAVFCKA